ncbi:MAG: beta-propeller fold lactonase family protein [Gammaproteobacteria bacterium]|nr:beta-propeller fold lactonase family protein [Gammaproteobacteria bacterium]
MKFSLSQLVVLSLLSSVALPVVSAPVVYLPLDATNEVAVIDAESGTVTARIPEVTNPHGLAITPDQRYLIAGAYTESQPDESSSPPKPSGVSAEDHQKHHQIGDEQSNNSVGFSFVSVVDVAAKQVEHRIEVKGTVHHIAVTPNGQFAIATHPTTGAISVIDLQLRTVVKVIPTGPLPNYVVVTNDNKRVYVSNAGNNSVSEIDTQDWTVSTNFTTGAAPEHVVLSPDETELYVNNVGDGSVSVITLDSGQTNQTYNVGNTPHGIDLSEDGRTLFVASKSDNQLVAINLEDNTQRTLALDPAPYHVTSVTGTDTLYVSSRSLEKIWVVDQKSLRTTNEITLDGIGHQMVVSR